VTSLVIVHAQGVYQPPVHANTERDIGFKRSSDERAQTPRQDSSSGNPALLIGSGSYGCPILQRFRICTACSVCSCPLQLSHPGRLITQEYLLNSSCFQQGYHNAPHGAHRTCKLSKHPARQLPLLSLWPLRISRSRIRFERFPCRPSSCTELSSAPWQVVTPAATTATPSP
jgi:hypothetical protein